VDAAAEYLERAVKLDPNDRESRALLGLLRADPQGAESGLARVLRDETFVTMTFGTTCLEQGCLDEAAAVFTRLLRKDPNNSGAREGLEQTLRARSRRKG
jgi:cytochrome c-type biogenesis protein CcmH/NrfG